MTGLSVVLADDHEVVRAGMRALVESSSGMSVVGEARDGAEAIDRVRDLRPDVLVVDVSMPVLDGAAATERVTREFPAVKVLVLSAHEDRAHLIRAFEAGAAGDVLKRAAADELVRAIRVVAEGGTYLDPLLAGHLVRRKGRSPGSGSALADIAEPLSEREEEVLRRIAWGESNKEIASALGISTKTVETYKSRVSEKLGSRSRTDLVRYALQRGWLSES